MEYKVEDRIYYKGDMANVEDFGTITKIHPANKWGPLSYDIQTDDGRTFHRVWHLSFEPSPGRRFWLLSEWEAIRKAQLASFYTRMKESNYIKEA